MALRIVLSLLVGLWCAAARADDGIYAQLSAGAAVFRGQAPAANLAIAGDAFPGDHWQVSASFIGSSRFAGSGPPTAAPANLAIGVEYMTQIKQLDIGLGPSWMRTPWPYNGDHVNFNLSLGYRFKTAPVTLWWTHYSCGGICWPNYGRDLVLAGWRFQ